LELTFFNLTYCSFGSVFLEELEKLIPLKVGCDYDPGVGPKPGILSQTNELLAHHESSRNKVPS